MKQPNLAKVSRGMALLFGTAALVAACGGSDEAPAPVPPPAPVAPPTPAPPPAPALVDQIAARINYFGAENVNATTGEIRKDLVIMSWLTNTTYAAAINGKVVLLDASLLRREQVAGRTPTTLAEMVNVMPSYILVGKASPGHVDLAANIAFRAGATVVGAQEHCDAIETDARRQQNWSGEAKLLKCTAVVPKDQTVGSTINVASLADLATCVRAVKHTDQSVAAADPTLPASSFDWSVGTDARDPMLYPAGTAASDGVTTTAPATGPSVVYHLTVGADRNFAFVWNDRAGSLKENAPAALALLRNLPKTDLQVGSVDVANAKTNGLRDAAYYVQAVRPKIFFAAGHDAASQRAGALNTGELMRRALESSIANVGVTGANLPDVRINFDPSDYVKPHYMTFDPASPSWQRAGDKASSTACS